MPIILDDINDVAAATTKTYNPQFFSPALTGNGRKSGLLKEIMNPKFLKASVKKRFDSNLSDNGKQKYKNNNTEVQCIPLTPIRLSIAQYMEHYPTPEARELTVIASNPSNPDNEIAIAFDMHSVVIETTPKPKGSYGGPDKTITISYGYNIVRSNDKNRPYTDFERLYKVDSREIIKMNSRVIPRNSSTSVERVICHNVTNNIARTLMLLTSELENNGWLVNHQAIAELLEDLSCYDMACKRSEMWQTAIDSYILNFLEEFAYILKNPSPSSCSATTAMKEIKLILHDLENYDIPLDLYRPMYHGIQNMFDPDIAHELCKANLNLLLSDTLEELNQDKHLLPQVPCDKIAPANTQLSPEQKRAVTATEPLVVLTSGAGCGKSTCVTNRVEQMIRCGINPADILVLSFTNAATNHIASLSSDIRSMTISSMIHTIYQMTYPEHELSTCETMLNSLDIFFDKHPLSKEFKRRLIDISKNENNAYTRLNEFVEANFDEVINMLNTMSQTTLELEIVICYQQIDNMQEPADIQSKHIIIDETQDNSLFEFVYAWKYVHKHKESLFVVGDPSQTLFEFRGAKARALNVMEGSGIFATYKIETNYRSNQEILDFANVVLEDIEANQYAQVRLRSNDLTPVTEQSFRDAVQLNYHQIHNLSELEEILENCWKTELKPYVDSCIAKGEKVAFLSYQGKYANMFQEWAEDAYGENAVCNLIPEKTYASTVFSEYIRRYWEEVQFMNPAHIGTHIRSAVISHLDDLVRNSKKSYNVVLDMLMDWENESAADFRAWNAALTAGTIDHNTFLEYIMGNMLDYEIHHNAVKQAMTSQRNHNEEKAEAVERASVICSTIHSAKGLEFDNTIVLFKTNNQMSEENKRLYYVALTRAKKSELVFAYGDRKNPGIVSQFDTICDTLAERDTAAVLNAINTPTPVGNND